MRVFNVVLYLRNKYLNLKPSESLSTEVGRKESCVCVCVLMSCPAPRNVTLACTIPATPRTFQEIVPPPWAQDARSVVTLPLVF